jgi:hypothetical protein
MPGFRQQRNCGSIPGRDETFLSSSQRADSQGTIKIPIEHAPESLFLAVKRPECEADHSLSSSAEYKIPWSYVSIPANIFTALCLIKHRYKFIILPFHTDRMFGLYYIVMMWIKFLARIRPVAASCE